MMRLQMEVRSTNTGITYPNSGWTNGSGPKNEVALTTQHVGEKKQLKSIVVIKPDEVFEVQTDCSLSTLIAL